MTAFRTSYTRYNHSFATVHCWWQNRLQWLTLHGRAVNVVTGDAAMHSWTAGDSVPGQWPDNLDLVFIQAYTSLIADGAAML